MTNGFKGEYILVHVYWILMAVLRAQLETLFPSLYKQHIRYLPVSHIIYFYITYTTQNFCSVHILPNFVPLNISKNALPYFETKCELSWFMRRIFDNE